MKTFDINKDRTKHREILESVKKQGEALKFIHNPNTWRLSALSFSLYLNDCTILFEDLKKRWEKELPFYEAWDVDFGLWKNELWSPISNITRFNVTDDANRIEKLCDIDYHIYVTKARKCLEGQIPINDIINFLKDKNTQLECIIINIGETLIELLAEIEKQILSAPSDYFIQIYDDLMSIYMSENSRNPYPIDNGIDIIPFEKWITSKSESQVLRHIPQIINSINSSMIEVKFWKEDWEDCVDIQNRTIDKEGLGRSIYIKRDKIIGSKTYPCKSSLYKCFSSLALCTHLWEYEEMKNSGIAYEKLSDSRKIILSDIENLIDKGIWKAPLTEKTIKNMMRAVLGLGEKKLYPEETTMSEKLWTLFENRRGGNALRVTFQNMIGYWDYKGLFGYTKSSPYLNRLFFNSVVGSDNINKGRPNKPGMNNDFNEIIPLLDHYCPKL